MKTRKINPALDAQLTTAIEAGSTPDVVRLLKEGANPDALVTTFRRNRELHSSDEEKKHLLHLAVELDFNEIVQLLLKHGANPALKDSHELTPIELAMRQHNISAIITFAEFVPLRPNILGEALWHVLANRSEDCLPLVKTLLEQGADPNVSQPLLAAHGSKSEVVTCLSLAARYCSLEVTTLLLQYGAQNKDLSIPNEKKQKTFDALYNTLIEKPNFISDKEAYKANRNGKTKAAENFELELQQRQETRRLADVQNQIDVFVKIYTALRDGQSGLIKTNFLAHLRSLSPDAQLAAIQNHAEKQGSRTAKAWELAQKYGHQCDNKNVDLIAHIYYWSFSQSGLFKKSCVSGITLFNHGEIIAQKMALMREDELSQFADNNTNSRTAKILRALS